MSANRAKLATKRKIDSRKDASHDPKRSATKWSVKDLKNIECTKQPKISQQVDLDTAPHMFISSTKIIPIGSINGANVDGSVEDVEEDGGDETRMLRYQLLKSPTSTFQNEKENAALTIGEKVNKNQLVGFSQERNEGEQREQLIALDVTILNSHGTTYADNESSLDSNGDSFQESDKYTESVQNVETPEKIIISDLINGGNTIWDEVLERYKRNGKMNKKQRKAVINAIVQYAVFKKIFIDNDSMADISSQICTIFPTETAASYFVKVGKKPSGKLYNLYHRKRAEYTKEEREREKTPEETLLEPTESLDILKNDGSDDNVYIQKWIETFEYRQKKILKYESYDDFNNEWPIIEKPIGSILINMDFKTIYKMSSLTSHNWNLFFSNNWTFFTKNISEKGKRFCKKIYKLEESPAKDAALSLVLHYLLPPAYGGLNWKPTYVDSQNTFLKFIKEECIDKEIENRNEECTLRGIKWHPYIIGQGHSNRKIKHFYVVIHNTKIKTDNFLSALDFCMKLYILLNIPYPPESGAIWILVNKMFYNIKVDPLMTSRIIELVNDLN